MSSYINFISGGAAGDPFISNVKLLVGFQGADASTTIPDESPSARGNATVSGNAQIDTAQFKFGSSSGLFDGNGDAVSWADHTDFDLPSQWTIESWVRFNSTSGDQAIFGTWNPPSDGYLFRFNSNALEWFCFGGTNLTGSSWTPSTGVWYHVAVERDGTATRIYADGNMIGSTTGAQTGVPTRGPCIGAQAAADLGRPFNGWIQETRYTHRARYISDTTYTIPTAAFPRS